MEERNLSFQKVDACLSYQSIEQEILHDGVFAMACAVPQSIRSRVREKSFREQVIEFVDDMVQALCNSCKREYSVFSFF